MTDPKKQTNTDTTAELPPVGDDASAVEALRKKLIDLPPWISIRIHTAKIRSLAIARKKAEEAERAGAFMENALSEQAASESGDDQTQAFITDGESLFDAIAHKKSEEG